MTEHYVRTYKKESTYRSGRHEERAPISGFYAEIHCDLVMGCKTVAWFSDMGDAIVYGQMKAHCLCIDFHQDILMEETKKKKRGKK